MAKRMTKAAIKAAYDADMAEIALEDRRRARLRNIDAEDRAFAERQKRRIYREVFGRQNFHEEGRPESI